MVRKFWLGLSSHARALTIVAAIGFVIGAIFGDMLFIVVEFAIGDPWDGLVLGLGGAALASLGYEIVASVRRTT
jgi:hypothetical protein